MAETDPSGQIGPYLLDEVVGRGSSGVVWRAYDGVSGEVVAVKMLDAATREDPLSRARFARECELVGAFFHPGLVRLRAAGRTDSGGAYLVMDLALGTTLRNRWAHGTKSSEAEVLWLVLKIAEAVDAMHQAGWVHRDLKPANVILDPEHQQPRLLDFGVAAPLNSDRQLTEAGYFVGTPVYLAPEQLLGARPAATMDVYALGCILYEGLVGQPPFRGGTDFILTQKSSQDPPKYSGHRALDELLAASLSRRPEGRPHHAGAFANALRKATKEIHPDVEHLASAPTPVFDYTSADTITSQLPTDDLAKVQSNDTETMLQPDISDLLDASLPASERNFFGEDASQLLKSPILDDDVADFTSKIVEVYFPAPPRPATYARTGVSLGLGMITISALLTWGGGWLWQEWIIHLPRLLDVSS